MVDNSKPEAAEDKIFPDSDEKSNPLKSAPIRVFC
jgi:hypothetical protein